MTTHDSITEALESVCTRPRVVSQSVQPSVCRKATVEIHPFVLEQLRARSSHGLSIRTRKPTIKSSAFDSDAAVAEFGNAPTTRTMGVDDVCNLIDRVTAEQAEQEFSDDLATQEFDVSELAVRFAHLGRQHSRRVAA